ncbi:lysozyme inhibitor LprI family protein [Neisseriaceae bacterium B1]
MMYKYFFLYLFLISFSYAAPMQKGSPEWQYNPCAHLPIGFELGKCIDDYYEQSEKKMNKTFKNMLNVIGKDDLNGQKHWLKSQKMWRDWIEYECLPSDPRHNSSYAPVMIKMCQANKMQLRERHLRYIFM